MKYIIYTHLFFSYIITIINPREELLVNPTPTQSTILEKSNCKGKYELFSYYIPAQEIIFQYTDLKPHFEISI
jgi:hypothetical protein